MYQGAIKRMIDLVLSLMALIVLLPIFLIIIVMIKIDDPGPAFFVQKRIGKNKKWFDLYKFRSMKVNTPDVPTHLLENPEQYISRVGKFLRKSSLDELPQLINIIKGEMSIIGPRPALWNQDDLIAERDKYGANDVRPGLSGWAQVNGRDELEIPLKAKLDGEYVKNIGFIMDVKCLLKTVLAVISSDGVVEGKADENKKTIVILSNHDVLTYKFRKEVIQALLAEGYRVVITLPYGEKVEEMKAWGCEYIDIPAFSRHSTSIVRELKLILGYRKLLKEVKPDFVLAYTIKPNLYGGFVAATLKIPFGASVTGLGTAVQNKGKLQHLVKFMYKICLRKACCVFAQNQEIKEFLKERKVKGKIVLVAGSGVNLAQHRFEEYPQEEEKITFITIGRLMRDKGINELLSAAREIKKDYPNVRFQLIGFDDGNYKEIVEAAVRENVVEYPGFQDDVHPWITNSHAIVHPSYHEGMANVLLECAATGRPIIASDIPGCQETFEEGVSGIGFKPQDAEDLTRALRQFLELTHEKKAQMGRAGHKKMEKEFNRDIIVKTYLDEIKCQIG